MAAEQNLVPISELSTAGPWESLLLGEDKTVLESQMPAILRTRRWFGAKGREIASTEIVDSIPIEHGSETSYLSLVNVRYLSGTADVYVVAISHATGERARELLADGSAAFATVRSQDGGGVLYDAAHNVRFTHHLLDIIGSEQRSMGERLTLEGVHTDTFLALQDRSQSLVPKVMRAEQSNTSIVFGDKLILKLFRRLQPGTNPDFEVGRFLTEHGFRNTPVTAGALQLRSDGAEPTIAAILQAFVQNRGDAWKYTLDSLDQILRRAETDGNVGEPMLPEGNLLDLTSEQPPPELENVAGEYLESARLLGRRTAEMQLALAGGTQPAFEPEPFSPAYQQQLSRSMEALASQALDALERNISRVSSDSRTVATFVLQRRNEIAEELRAVAATPISAARVRIHGDYHLGQVLYTGEDFMIIDFEGEPMRSVEERRIKRSPLQDVAGMLRSFDYAASSMLQPELVVSGRDRMMESKRRVLRLWQRWTSATFLSSYLRTCGHAPFIPQDRSQLETLLNSFLLEKAAYELSYEINNRPAWIGIPIAGILQILDSRRARVRRIRTA